MGKRNFRFATLIKGFAMLPTEPSPAAASALTERYFRENMHNCAEAVLRAVLTVYGRECPTEMTRLASPFGRGMGEAGCACGALVGGQMAIGHFFGRLEEQGYPPEICAEASKKLHNKFKKENGATCCRILRRDHPFGTDEQFNACCERAKRGAELTTEIISKLSAKQRVQSGT